MAKQLINLGNENAGNGDPLRLAFSKINGNFSELYDTIDGFNLTNSIPSLAGNGGKYLTNDGTDLTWSTIPSDLSDLTDNTNLLATVTVIDGGTASTQF